MKRRSEPQNVRYESDAYYPDGRRENARRFAEDMSGTIGSPGISHTSSQPRG